MLRAVWSPGLPVIFIPSGKKFVLKFGSTHNTKFNSCNNLITNHLQGD